MNQPNWELKGCCNHDQRNFMITIGLFTVVILAVEGIEVHANEGGLTRTRGGAYWLILPAGYIYDDLISRRVNSSDAEKFAEGNYILCLSLWSHVFGPCHPVMTLSNNASLNILSKNFASLRSGIEFLVSADIVDEQNFFILSP
uniref:Uncharacterized protein n=1 Tax=Chenopodium quinoa TaxID=63459 RepID=A0A803M4C3_CHEQI